MGLLDQEIVDRLNIQRIIFHVVGPEEKDLQLMDEVDTSGFESFFIDRIRETNIGNRFEFIGLHSGVRPALQTMHEKPDQFVQLSKQIAETFQGGHQAVAASRGAFIVAQIDGAPSPIFALIKFDDQRVLRFRQETTTAGGVRAVVSEVDNTFIEDKRAMQKSALIVLTEDGGDLAVYDRANQRNIGEYFKAFLGVRRLWKPEDATRRLVRALDSAFSAVRDTATDDVKRSWRGRLHDATRNRETVDPGEGLNVFGSEVFGNFWQNEKFRSTVDRELHRNRISGEVIEIDKAVIRRPIMRRLKTHENILILYPRQLDDAKNIVEVAKRPDGGATITIRTQGITDDEFLDEGAGGRSPPSR